MQRRLSRAYRVSAALALLVLPLSACSSGGSTNSVSGDTETADTGDTASPAAAADDAETQSGGDLRVVVDALQSEDLDPMLYASNAQQTFYPMVFDPLIALDPETGDLVPGLATEWDVSEDGTWTIALREGVEFTNGEAFTAEDVKFSLERYVGDGGESAAVGASRMAEYIDEITVVDDTTVEVATTGGAALPYDIAAGQSTAAGFMVPMDYVEEVGADEFNSAPIGTGPFVFVSQQPGSNMVFEANPDYWGDVKPSVDTVTLEIVADISARLAMLEAGEADIVSGVTGPAIPQVLESDTLGSRVAEKSSLVTMQIGGQTNTDSPLSDVQVRRAISHAIDRQGIVDNLLFGHGEPAYLFGFPAGLGWPSDAETLVHEYDPEAARELLAEAGYADGFDLTLYGATFGSNFVEAVAQNLSEVGINVETQIVETDAALAEFQSEEGKQNTRIVLVFGPSGHGARVDVSGLLSTHFDASSTYAQPTGDDELLSLLAEQASIADPEERDSKIAEAMTRVFEEAHVIPAWHVDTVFAVAPSVSEWQPTATFAYPGNLQSVRLSE